jgi:hypothetical protein
MADTFFAAELRLPSARPLPLVASTCCWVVLTVFAFAYSTFVVVRDWNTPDGVLEILPIAVLAVFFLVSCNLLVFLWSYWQGYAWTRIFAIVGLVVKAINYLWLASLPDGVGLDLVHVAASVDFLFSLYILYWLTTRQARSYFTALGRTRQRGVVS